MKFPKQVRTSDAREAREFAPLLQVLAPPFHPTLYVLRTLACTSLAYYLGTKPGLYWLYLPRKYSLLVPLPNLPCHASSYQVIIILKRSKKPSYANQAGGVFE